MRPKRKIRIIKKNKKGKRWDAILNRLPKNILLLGAEIGVWQGKTSCRLLAERPNLRLIMVDPWKVPRKDSSYYKTGDDNARKTKEQHNSDYRRTIKKVAFAKDRAIIMKTYSKDAAKEVQDNTLDFVFIDGDHSYKGVKEDIQLWLSKIKNGGFISGHDYNHPRLPGVKKAVDEMFGSNKVILDINRTWFVRV